MKNFVLFLISISLYTAYADSPAEKRAKGLEKRYRFFLQEVSRHSPEERYPAMLKAEEAKKRWWEVLKFLDQPTPEMPGAIQIEVPENEEELWPEVRREGKSAELRVNAVPGIWVPKWGESYQSRRKRKKDVTDPSKHASLISASSPFSERELRVAHKLQLFAPSVEMQLKMEHHHLLYSKSRELKLTPPDAFSESSWMLWEQVNASAWKKTHRYGEGVKEITHRVRQDGSYGLAFILLNHRPKESQEAHYIYSVDTQSPVFSYLNVVSSPQELLFSWNVEDELIYKRSVTLSIYDKDRHLMVSRSEFLNQGEYILKAPFKVGDAFSVDIKAKDLSGNTVFLQKEI